MNKKTKIIIIMMLSIVIALVLITLIYILYNQNQAIGGETDKHGCLISAGYSWNDSIGACLREWELDESQRQAAKIAIAPLSFPVTIVEVKTFRCVGCFIIELQRNDNQNIFQVELAN
jgi:flagellar basal body-associated protein FliL